MIPHQAPGTRHALSTKHQAPGTCASVALLVALAALAACGPSPEQQRLRDTTKATYDKATGRLERLTYDANKDGVIDTWTYMDGTKVLRSEIDKNQDGKIDRWEYYGDDGKTVVKVAVSKADNGKPDTWLYPGAGRPGRARRDLHALRRQDRPAGSGTTTARSSGPRRTTTATARPTSGRPTPTAPSSRSPSTRTTTAVPTGG